VSWPAILALFALTVAAMEGFAYATHRWVMHGPGWFLHASHHRLRSGWFEWNDLYGVIFALPSITLIWLGVRGGWGDPATTIGAGIAAYGAIYFGFHDWIVHQRLPHRIVPRSRYFKRIVQAHRLHHVVESKHGAVSFGFLLAPPIERLRAELRASPGARLRGAQLPD
jgi:beta-carotene 3-hydroxylase